MLEWIKQLAIYAVLIVIVVFGAIYIPSFFSRVAVPSDYSELHSIELLTDFPLDPTIPISRLEVGDGIAWRLPGSSEGDDIGLGWFAGGPGDIVEIDRTGTIVVNGKKFDKPGLVTAPPCRVIIPEYHYFAVTNGHNLDSIKHGPLTVGTYRGRVRGLP